MKNFGLGGGRCVVADAIFSSFDKRESKKKKRGRREALRVELLEKYKYLRIATEKKNEKPPKKVAHRARQFKESAGRIKHAIASRNHQFLRPKLAFSIHTCFE